ncbi:MAG: hypothetical protein RI949_2655 [Pseudomonadota bacterium]|jgi:NMD protein affecting ribosome stability and mRNA decay
MSKPSKAQSHHAAGSRTHGTGVLRAERHDPYLPFGKLPEGSTCPTCQAQVHKGHWVLSPASEGMHTAANAGVPGSPRASVQEHLCPACTRIALRDPAGTLHLKGRYVTEHEAELRALLAHTAEHERTLHPLERIMAVQRQADGSLEITTTGIHLVRVVGHALQRAHHGHLEINYLEGESRVRSTWTRDD